MTSGLQCGIVSLLTNFEEVPLIDVHQIGQHQLLLQGLKSSTIYDYCVSAFDTVTSNTIGFQLCGKVETGQKGNFFAVQLLKLASVIFYWYIQIS